MTKGEEIVLVVFRMFKICFKIVALGFLFVGVVGYAFFKSMIDSAKLVPQRN